MAKKEEEKKPLFRGFCDRDNCEFYCEVEDVSFSSPTGKMIIEMCSWNDAKRSFGCMANCPNR